MKSISVLEFEIWRPDGKLAPFTLHVYGISFEAFLPLHRINELVQAALNKKGFNDYTAKFLKELKFPPIFIKPQTVHEPFAYDIFDEEPIKPLPEVSRFKKKLN